VLAGYLDNVKNQWFANMAREGKLLYANMEKVKHWSSAAGTNSLWNATNALFSEHTVLIEADLVNKKTNLHLMFMYQLSLFLY